MIKVFISQPMKDKTNEQIEKEREQIISFAKKECGDDIEIIDSFFKDAPHDARPLWFLGKSLELLSTADIIIMGKGWVDARGCRIEQLCANEYGIKVLYQI